MRIAEFRNPSRNSIVLLLCAAVFAAALVWTSALVLNAQAQDSKQGPIEGLATVTDGDGLEIDGERIRLFGIDAPEVQQYCKRKNGTRWHCGQYSTVALDKFVAGKKVTCHVRTLDSYARWVATCSADGIDLGERQVEQGWAVAYRRYSKDYIDEEDAARKAGNGLWAGEFKMPWEWRAGTRGR